MSKTQIGGNRVRKKSLTFDHFTDDTRFPESMLNLLYPTHNHINKDVIDKIRYSGVKLSIDLRDFELIMMEVVGARKDGYSLGSTIDGKANKGDFLELELELAKARGTYSTLDEAIKAYGIYVESELQAHKGSVGHSELDKMFNDYVNSKAGLPSLADRLNGISVGTGGGTGTGSVNVLNPWKFKYTIKNDSNDEELNRTITMPYSYVPDSNTIEVFENALLMEAGSDKDYEEVDANTIRFNYKLPTGTIVNVTGINGGTLYQWKQVYKTTSGQINFNTMDSYILGSNDLVVYESGMLMTKDEDYEEVTATLIRFKYQLPENVQVTIYRRR